MTLSRRSFLRLSAGLAAGAGLSACGGIWAPQQTGQLVRSAVPMPAAFTVPLPRLQPLAPVRTDRGTDYFEVEQRAAAMEILPGMQTSILGYEGTFPGPLLETRAGRRAIVRHTNALAVPVAVHLHGGHTPANSDGYPTDLVQPGESRDYDYPMRQRAATLWYHDHRMDFTGEQVYSGLLGMHLVRDDEDDALALPKGEREVPLVIVDRAFDEHGELAYPTDGGHHGWVDDAHVEGVLGDVMLVNGAPWPVLEVDAARYRFRILNGCNSRRLELALDPPATDGPSFVQVGSDGGLLAAPVAHSHLRMAQAERLDVIVDFARYPAGAEVTLVNRFGSGPTTQVLRFVVVRRGADDSAPVDQLPQPLSRVTRLDVTGAAVREWRFSRGPVDGRPGWVVNGRWFDPARMDASVSLGEVEIWRFHADLHHPVHVHLDPFQVLSRGGRGPGAFDGGWKDTVDVGPAEHVDVAVRFSDYTGAFLLHCHNLEHEDRMMMAAFQTV